MYTPETLHTKVLYTLVYYVQVLLCKCSFHDRNVIIVHSYLYVKYTYIEATHISAPFNCAQ